VIRMGNEKARVIADQTFDEVCRRVGLKTSD